MFCFLVVSGCALVAPVAAATRIIELPAEVARLKASTLAGYSIAREKCGICHSADYILYQPPQMTQAQWATEMQKMQHSYGAPIDAGEIRLLGIYLAAVYGDASSVSASDRQLTLSQVAPNAAAPGEGASAGDAAAQGLLTANGCLACHGLNQKVVGPAYHTVAAKYRHDPQAVSKVTVNIRSGGSGKWGTVPMPPFPGLSQEQLQTLARFVLAQ
jgi:cytochrome c551/c552